MNPLVPEQTLWWKLCQFLRRDAIHVVAASDCYNNKTNELMLIIFASVLDNCVLSTVIEIYIWK